MTISGFVAYVKQAWKNKPDTSTPLSAARLTHVEEGVKANSDAIAKIAAAVINQQANDANKIPSSALMYSVNEKVDSAISDLGALARIGSIEKIEFGYNSGTAGYEFVYIGFKVVNWATFQLRIFVQSNPSIKASLFKVENGTYTKMWDL